MNSYLFSLRYEKKLTRVAITAIPVGYSIIPLKELSAEKIMAFFDHQPEDAFTFFHPHGFDKISIMRLQNNKSFLAYALLDKTNDKIAGYCFIRVFVAGWWI